MDAIDMTIILWASLLTHSGITQTVFDQDAVQTLPCGPMVIDENQRTPLIVFQSKEQMEFFNEHANEIRSRLTQ